MLGKIKSGLIWAGAILAAAGVAFLYIFGLGRKIEQAEMVKQAEREENEHDSRIADAHAAGNAARVQPVQKDPYDRAQR